jgi:magnesium transporter
MTNTLFLPELREMLAENNTAELDAFCTALHPARTAEFMEGLTVPESWEVLRHADAATRVQIFSYFEHPKQIEALSTMDRGEVARLIENLPGDDRVDLLREVKPQIVAELLPLVPLPIRREILRLQEYPKGTAGALMTPQYARLRESLTVREAIDAIGPQVADLETVYYLYVVDDEEHLRGLVSARKLIQALASPQTRISDLMDRAVVSVDVGDDQEEVAKKVARYDFLAIPVVDHEHHMLGIITHDDVIDVFREEAVEDALRLGGVQPLDGGYLQTRVLTLAWKRGVWLMLLFLAGLCTATALDGYQSVLLRVEWLVFFIPLVMSSGGNSGNQSATLIITGLSSGTLTVGDWMRILRRELSQGFVLGSFLGMVGYAAALVMGTPTLQALILPIALILVVCWGTTAGALLPLIFKKLGLDPAMMSNPAVASLTDIVGIVIYMTVALLWI